MINRFDIHRKAIEHYGKAAQISKAQEEMGELSDELSYCELLSGTGTREALLSEIADVCNMIEQLAIILNFYHIEIDTEQNRKMARTLRRIEGNE